MINNDSNDTKKIMVIVILIALLATLIVSKVIIDSNKTKESNKPAEITSNEKTPSENKPPLQDKEEEEQKETEENEENEEETEKLTFTYENEEYNLTSNDKKVVISSVRKFIKDTKDANINKAIKVINDNTSKKWQELKTMMDDQIATLNEEGTPDEEEYGVNYGVIDYSNKKIVTFVIMTTGSMGGVPWNEEEGYSFDRTTGNQLTLNDICMNETKCKDFLLDYFLLQLKNDERYENLYDDYKTTVEKDIYKDGNWYLNDEGLVLIVPKYEISDGGAGLFSYTIPYNIINDYLNEKYKNI
jgi:hypothetical protein